MAARLGRPNHPLPKPALRLHACPPPLIRIWCLARPLAIDAARVEEASAAANLPPGSRHEVRGSSLLITAATGCENTPVPCNLIRRVFILVPKPVSKTRPKLISFVVILIASIIVTFRYNYGFVQTLHYGVFTPCGGYSFEPPPDSRILRRRNQREQVSAYDELHAELKAVPKTCLGTGVAGFIGSNLLAALRKLYQQVAGFDDFSTGDKKDLVEVKAPVSPA